MDTATTTKASKASPPAALAGLKVLELGQLIAGPFAAKTLADFGAEVIKIEPPGAGDPLRKWRMLKDGTSVWWQVQSRNKRSLALDLRPGGQEVVRKLAREADVLIENFRPGALEGWGLAPESLLELNPRLIVLRISGYGQTGPYRNRPGFGVIGEAMGGLRHLTARPARVPVRVGVEHRRHAGSTARRGWHPARPAPAGRERQGPDHRCRVVRGGLQLYGKPASGVQRFRRSSRSRLAVPCPGSLRPTPTAAMTAATR